MVHKGEVKISEKLSTWFMIDPLLNQSAFNQFHKYIWKIGYYFVAIFIPNSKRWNSSVKLVAAIDF